jgi:tetratricopeptide (TPR) repeat protein
MITETTPIHPTFAPSTTTIKHPVTDSIIMSLLAVPAAAAPSSLSSLSLPSFCPLLIRSLLQVGADLYSNGCEKEAMEVFEAAHALLREPVSELLARCAARTLEAGVRIAEGSAAGRKEECEEGADEDAGEDQQCSPDLYLEDECDVGPRVLRLPAHLEESILPSSMGLAVDHHPHHLLLLDSALAFNKALIYHNNLDFSEAKRLYQHVLASIRSLLLVSGASPTYALTALMEMGAQAHNNLGHISYVAGDEEVARSHFEAALLCARRIPTSVSPSPSVSRRRQLSYASILSNWCRVGWMRGDSRSDGLHAALGEVLRIRQALLRWNHADVAASHFNVAAAEYARRNNPAAVDHLMHYLRLVSDHAKDKLEDLDPIPALIYLLLIQNEDKDDSMSQELVRGLRTLQEKRQDQGPDSPEVASVLNFIGTLLFHKEDHTNALLFFQEELRLEENMPDSSEDISVSVTCNNIGRILQELGKLSDAIHYYHRALKPHYGDIKVAGSSSAKVGGEMFADAVAIAQAASAHKCGDHPASSANLYSTVWYNLGLIHDKLGSFRDAIAAFEMSLALRRSMLGNDHPDIACLMYNIGVLQMEQQHLAEATASFREALRIRRGGATGQLNDRHVVKTLEKLSSLHKAKGNIAGALDALREVLHIQEISGDYDALSRRKEAGATLRNMSELHHASGDLPSALLLAVQSVHQLRGAVGQDYVVLSSDPMDQIAVVEQLVSSLLLIGSLYHEMCEPLNAITILQEAYQVLQLCRSHASPHLFSSLRALREVTKMLATSYCAAQA